MLVEGMSHKSLEPMTLKVARLEHRSELITKLLSRTRNRTRQGKTDHHPSLVFSSFGIVSIYQYSDLI